MGMPIPPTRININPLKGRQPRTPKAEGGIGDDVSAATGHKVKVDVVGLSLSLTDINGIVGLQMGGHPLHVIRKEKETGIGMLFADISDGPLIVRHRTEAKRGKINLMQIIAPAHMDGHGIG